MLHAILIEGKAPGIEKISALLSVHFPQLHLIACCRFADAGIRLARKFNPDLIIVNSELPDGSGFDVLDKLKDTPAHKILISLKTESRRATAYAPAVFITEPVSRKKLAAAMAQIGISAETPSSTAKVPPPFLLTGN